MSCFYYENGSCLALPPIEVQKRGLFFVKDVPVYRRCKYSSMVHVRQGGMVVSFQGRITETKMSDCPSYKTSKVGALSLGGHGQVVS